MISLPFPSMTAASLHTVGHGCRVPLLVEKVSGKAWKRWRWRSLCPGVDTHRSPHSALFSKTGGSEAELGMS